MSFSNSGGTLALPSPTHAHHIDVTSAVRSLRRSISRSPSKFLSRTSSQSSDSSLQASPQSPSRRLTATPQRQHISPCLPQTAPPAVTSTHASAPYQSSILTPLRPSVRLSLRSAKSAKTTSPSPRPPLGRTRSSPRSPLKRTLHNVSDSGNSSQTSAGSSSPPPTPAGQENSRSPRCFRASLDKPSRHSFHLDVSGSSQHATLTALDVTNSESYMTSTTGALKRSDATMNLDYPNHGSPVAKRRSLHGIAGLGQAADVNIFGANTTSSQSFDIHEDGNFSEYELTNGSGGQPFTSRDALTTHNSTSSYSNRSSSLRRSTLQQRHGEKGSWGRRSGERQLAQIVGEQSTPARSRPRLSTDHFVPPQVPRESPFTAGSPLPNPSIHAIDKSHQPHPLSKTLTTSTSGNSLTEEAPPYAPAKPFEKAKAHPFSRSLPLNATRPTARSTAEHIKAVATPSHSSQLWIGAFNSTGLISKVNRNPEEDAERKIAPPDTPCKKHTNPFATFPPPVGSAIKKKTNNRNSFAGVPSTPFQVSSTRAPDTFGQPAKGLSIFQRGSTSSGSRRGSILSLEGEDRKLFCEAGDLPLDGDVPPTPTKASTLTSSLSNLSEQSLESPSTNRTFALPLSAVKPAPWKGVTGQSSAERPASLTKGAPNLESPNNGRKTPQTPHENLLPLDTSRLSISKAPDAFNETCMPPPVTPTAARDFRSSTSTNLTTPQNGRTSDVDIDSSLYSRFDKIEQVGKGEFSTVYRVTKMDHLPAIAAVPGTPSRSASASPAKGQVFAVKKSRHSYQGPRDRETKLREARILQALCHAEHVVQYVDDWEHNFHLYIQTEFCEEGTLDKFLGHVGRGGRLDDFRIFKILLDLSLGLKEIHEAGFMHLDMKPANIFITFEGAVKIGDFGLAQPCTSEDGVDVEGDREYMAPEMLKGKAGQSADVFSLGLMTLEAAANVMLPDNGPTWIALRSGDLTEVPSLTWTPSLEVQRDSNGEPMESAHSNELRTDQGSSGNLFRSLKQPQQPQRPEFMVVAENPSSLDSIVKWMTAQEPKNRPLIDQVLDLDGLRWVAEHRSAPATVYEGNWGPTEPFAVSIALDSDTEMTDV